MIEFTDSIEQPLVPAGFRFGSTTAGIKQSGKPDLACALAAPRTTAAAVFTTNQVAAAPVLVGHEHLRESAGRLRAVIVNSGNANCATGPDGLAAAKSTCASAAKHLSLEASEVLPSSTGIIGVPFPLEKVEAALPQLFASATTDNLPDFARAIMTTDTRPKIACARFKATGRAIALAGVAKGAGMIHPNMATMLVYLFTDAIASPAQLQSYLCTAADQTFNSISIDGDTSTNDTALLLASGASGVTIDQCGQEFEQALLQVCRSLAHQIVADGEGVKHVITLHVTGAQNVTDAKQIASTIATSPLVKTAWAGCDPNWGRMLAAIGRSGVAIDPNQISIRIGPHQVCTNGAVGTFDPATAHEFMRAPQYDIFIALGSGDAGCEYITCDLTDEYVHVNADYST
ncbi:MAG TPA: bifunctional glutamate N-acetyltransferase/amino-acid acetyltransferase ArgJ [Terriglobales bacterium]|jgi:glutamate N-acetyltransferase/amino-acid N-acetyltransferase